MLTATTITDAQIRELKAHGIARFERGVDTKEDREAVDECSVALSSFDHPSRRREARARCAEILNARAKAEDTQC